MISALADEGEFVDERGFTYDRAHAWTKLAERRLGHELAFAGLLVEVAHLLPGCERLDISFGGGGLCVDFIGGGLSEREVETLLDSALGGAQESAVGEAQRLLAIASCQALSLGEGEVELVRRGLSGTIALVVGGGGAVEVRRSDARSGVVGLRWRVRFAGMSWLLALVSLPARVKGYLRERCGHSFVPVFVDGSLVSRGVGPALPDAEGVVPLDDGQHARGFAGWEQESRACARVELLANGVLVETLYQQDWTPGFVAVLELGDLPRDLSLASFVRSEAFRECAVIAAHAHAVMVEARAAAEDARSPEAAEPERWSAAAMMAVVIAVVAVLLMVLGCALATTGGAALGVGIAVLAGVFHVFLLAEDPSVD